MKHSLQAALTAVLLVGPASGATAADVLSPKEFAAQVQNNPAAFSTRYRSQPFTLSPAYVESIQVDGSQARVIVGRHFGEGAPAKSDLMAGNVTPEVALTCQVATSEAARLQRGVRTSVSGLVHDVEQHRRYNPIYKIHEVTQTVIARQCSFNNGSAAESAAPAADPRDVAACKEMVGLSAFGLGSGERAAAQASCARLRAAADLDTPAQECWWMATTILKLPDAQAKPKAAACNKELMQ